MIFLVVVFASPPVPVVPVVEEPPAVEELPAVEAPPAVVPVLVAPGVFVLVVAPAGGAVVAGTTGMLAPGAVVPVVLAPGTPVVVPAGPAAAAPGVVVAPAAGAVTVRVTATVLPEPLEPASDTSAAVSAPSESTITLASAITGGRHRGVAARRVRAAAPHRRHHDCSVSSGPPHSGQRSPSCSCAGTSVGGGVAMLTPTRPAGG